MSQGRGSAFLIVIVAVMMVVAGVAEAATTYTVGDRGGWTFNVASWPRGKRFRAGDTLVFNYIAGEHNVVIVGKSSQDSCTVPNNAVTLSSGKDQIKLVRGANYFICGFPGHCGAGMSIAINAA